MGIFDYLTGGWGGQVPGLLNRPPDRPYDYDQPYQQPEQLLPKQDQPHTWDEAIQAWHDLTGIPDIQKGYETYQQGGGILPALGQAGMGAVNAASLAIPAAKALPGMIRTIGPMLGNEIGAVGDIGKLSMADRRAERLRDFKFPQYAEQYPPQAAPTMTWDPETAKMYPKKTFTPQEEEFAKERARIAADMKKGYTPYFDPAERSYVDPANYPPRNVDTGNVVPKMAASIEKYSNAVNAPETAQALARAYNNGLELGNAHDWYAMAQLEKKYIEVLGPKVGRERFLDEYAVPLAATTSGNQPQNNFLIGQYLEYNRAKGNPIPASGAELPKGVGGRRPEANLRDYTNMRERGGYAGLGKDQPKMHDFARSQLGDLRAPVMDEQMAHGMLEQMGGAFADNARTTAYGYLQDPVRALARKLGLAPGNVQDVAWAGFKNEPGKPMIQFINDAIERTHRLTGMPYDEIVERGLVKKEIPIYGLGALGLGGLGGLGGAGSGGS